MCGPDLRCGSDGGDAAIADMFIPPDVMLPYRPSNDLDPSAVYGIDKPLTATGTTKITIDTDTGAIVDSDGNVRMPGIGQMNGYGYYQTATLGVFSAGSLSLGAGTTLTAHGSRALVLFINGDVTIDGTIDVSAGVCDDGMLAPHCGGPGAGDGGTSTATATGCGPGGKGVANGDTGGGGGALGQSGAAGAQETDEMMAAGGAAGSIGGCPDETLVPLVGGSGGGQGGGGGAGGGGGGAIQISALGTLTISGTIASSGNGGRGASGAGGGGGGAGGAILLEAIDVVLASGVTLAANGGGAGSGSATTSGEAGRRLATAASGGSAGNAGGNGGYRTGAPTTGTPNINDTGGGGGGAGRIRINSQTESATSSSTISPAHTSGGLAMP